MSIRKKGETRISVSKTLANKIVSALIEWGVSHYRVFPWRKADNHFHALIAEVMLQRTRANQVEPVYNRFTILYPTINSAIEREPEEIIRVLEPLGLRWRAYRIHELICELSRLGGVPTSYVELIQLPGVGQYTASAMLSLHLATRRPLIDANTVRVWSRVFEFEADSETRRKKWFLDLVDLLTPDEQYKKFNFAVLDLAGTVCLAKPLCGICPLNQVCMFYGKEK